MAPTTAEDRFVKGAIYYSERWWKMLGYQPNELGKHTGIWLDLMHPDDRPQLPVYWRDLLGGDRETYSVEWRLRHRDCHYVPALRVPGTNTDLTERKQAEQHIDELATTTTSPACRTGACWSKSSARHWHAASARAVSGP